MGRIDHATEGSLAHDCGVEYAACPHTEPEARQRWQLGWQQAERYCQWCRTQTSD